MTEAQFRVLLTMDREHAASCLMERKVEEWMNDGQAEVVRCLSCWVATRQNLGNDDTLVELYRSYLDEPDGMKTVYVAGWRTRKVKPGELYELYAGPLVRNDIVLQYLPPPSSTDTRSARVWEILVNGKLRELFYYRGGTWRKTGGTRESSEAD